MKELVWSEHYTIGNSDIDRDHKALFILASKMANSFRDTNNRSQHLLMIRSFQNRISSHCRKEEEIMMAVRYPDFQDHRRDHRELIQCYVNMVNEFATVNSTVAYLDLLAKAEFLAKTWLCGHIVQYDLALRPHVGTVSDRQITGTAARPRATRIAQTWV